MDPSTAQRTRRRRLGAGKTRMNDPQRSYPLLIGDCNVLPNRRCEHEIRVDGGTTLLRRGTL